MYRVSNEALLRELYNFLKHPDAGETKYNDGRLHDVEPYFHWNKYKRHRVEEMLDKLGNAIWPPSPELHYDTAHNCTWCDKAVAAGEGHSCYQKTRDTETG